MVSLSLPLPLEGRFAHISQLPESPLLVVTLGGTLAAEFVARRPESAMRLIDISRGDAIDAVASEIASLSVSKCILFLNSCLTPDDRRAIDGLLPVFRRAKFVVIVSNFRVHFGDASAADAEEHLLRSLPKSDLKIVVFRPGHVLSAQSRTSQLLRRFGFLYPLMPRRIRTCFLDANHLFTAIDRELGDARQTASRRILTLLGPNRRWKDLLRDTCTPTFLNRLGICICSVLSLALLGELAAIAFDLLTRLKPTWRCWNFDTLRPRSFAELLAFCNRYNIEHVKLVGYNNGVVHFGHRFPNKTIISTVRCNRIRRVSKDSLKVDCGVTIRDAMQMLAEANQELPVVPNYSYVCLGTALFIPIHGSASDVTTVADTILQVLLFDPCKERFLLARCDHLLFRDTAYNLASNLILLRLWIRVNPRTPYFLQQKTHESADGPMLLDSLRDSAAANVEIRKSRASGTSVVVSKFYKATDGASTGCVKIPRDKLGQLWDRLEENPITSFLMHAFARTMIWHVELFLTADEFATFWETHQALPLRKIQLRYIRRDGLPHSPFCEHDCVSVDLFLFRWNRTAFEAYLKKIFPTIRTNPGKHSQ